MLLHLENHFRFHLQCDDTSRNPGVTRPHSGSACCNFFRVRIWIDSGDVGSWPSDLEGLEYLTFLRSCGCSSHRTWNYSSFLESKVIDWELDFEFLSIQQNGMGQNVLPKREFTLTPSENERFAFPPSPSKKDRTTSFLQAPKWQGLILEMDSQVKCFLWSLTCLSGKIARTPNWGWRTCVVWRKELGS